MLINELPKFMTSLGPASYGANCTKVHLRKEYRDLNQTEKAQFKTGMRALFRAPSMLARDNLFHDYVQVHNTISDYMHSKLIKLIEAEFQKTINLLYFKRNTSLPSMAPRLPPHDRTRNPNLQRQSHTRPSLLGLDNQLQ
jgi:hypothetical protein